MRVYKRLGDEEMPCMCWKEIKSIHISKLARPSNLITRSLLVWSSTFLVNFTSYGTINLEFRESWVSQPSGWEHEGFSIPPCDRVWFSSPTRKINFSPLKFFGFAKSWITFWSYIIATNGCCSNSLLKSQSYAIRLWISWYSDEALFLHCTLWNKQQLPINTSYPYHVLRFQ